MEAVPSLATTQLLYRLLKLQFCHENVLLNLSYFRYASAWNVREKESGPVYGMEWDRALIEILARFDVF